MMRPREHRTRPDWGRANRKAVAALQSIPGYAGRYATLPDEALDYYAAPNAPPPPHPSVLKMLGEITRHRERRLGPVEDLPEPPPKDPEQVRYRHLYAQQLKMFADYTDARKALSDRRKERSFVNAQKRRFINNPPPRDRMTRKSVFRYWTECPSLPLDPNTCAGDVSARNYTDAAHEVFDLLYAFDYEPDTLVKVWIQHEDTLVGPLCFGATAWETGDFSEAQLISQESL